MITIIRLRRHQATRDYVGGRHAENKSKSKIIRCLKRYLGREVLAALPPLAPGHDIAA